LAALSTLDSQQALAQLHLLLVLLLQLNIWLLLEVVAGLAVPLVALVQVAVGQVAYYKVLLVH
jgi:hypothetical protein